MGDRSPKDKQKHKKQHDQEHKQKQAHRQENMIKNRKDQPQNEQGGQDLKKAG